MKKFLLLFLLMLISSLTACDSFEMSEEEKNANILNFIDYLDSDDYGEMYFYHIIDNSENEYRIDYWETKDSTFIMDTKKELNLYYRDEKLYSHDIVLNTKTSESFNADDLEYDFLYNEFLDKLLLILNDNNYAKYVVSVQGSKSYSEHKLIYTFDTNNLIEDNIFDEIDYIQLVVTIDLDDKIYGFDFKVTNQHDTIAITFEREIIISNVDNCFPNDLSEYIDED